MKEIVTRYVLLFIAIQLASLVLTVAGFFVCGALAASGIVPWPAWAWVWNNRIDGLYGPGNPHTKWQAFYWTALRNPCNNLRFVAGVSKVGRPLWRRTWGAKPGGWYFQAGWNNSGQPVLSGGRNVNPW
jgi:hypothetical protein